MSGGSIYQGDNEDAASLHLPRSILMGIRKARCHSQEGRHDVQNTARRRSDSGGFSPAVSPMQPCHIVLLTQRSPCQDVNQDVQGPGGSSFLSHTIKVHAMWNSRPSAVARSGESTGLMRTDTAWLCLPERTEDYVYYLQYNVYATVQSQLGSQV